MEYLANTDQLVRDGVLTGDQASEIQARSRETMMTLAINALLVGGIITATLGLIFWLAEPVPVAIAGLLALVAGALVLRRGSDKYRIFGNAAALIGAGMLLGGASIELVKRLEDGAAIYLFLTGGAVTAAAAYAYRRGGEGLQFLTGSIALMGGAVHLAGLIMFEPGGLGATFAYGYSAAVIFGLGLLVDVRLISALAIVPLAQMLDTSTAYFRAAYVFYSPEPALSILQMAAVIALCLWASARFAPRIARHFGVLMMLGFVVLNLCFLVGSLWGDTPGDTLWGISTLSRSDYQDYEAYNAAYEAYRASALSISAGAFSIIWALVLAAVVLWAAINIRRGPLNAALTFAAIHAYTQAFETFGAEPLVFALGGLAAIPVAWGLMQVNASMKAREGMQVSNGS
ncbi:hypothetical protein MNBD_ALPHA07-743 [hydrothermal vent metagenome]|uniref:DUF2157 domain-containing protein n=1 Tax=hydrothermal vent metagenome TaxID=652676 RepID=A0A3B0SXN0_9ZZZZ